MAASRKPPPLSKIIEKLIEEGIQFYMNSLLKPVVYIPDDPYQKYWEVGHERFHAHVSAAYHSLTKEYLRTADRDMLIEILKEECYKGGRRLTEVEAALVEKDSIIQAVLLYLSYGKDDFDGLTRDLLRELRKDFIQDRIVPPDPDFPVLTNIFSRRLNALVPALRDLGVHAETSHAEDGSHCKLRRLETFMTVADALESKASGHTSGATPSTAKGTAAPDGTDGNDDASGKEHPYVNQVNNK